MRQPFRYVALGDSTGLGVGAREGRGYVDRLALRLARRFAAGELSVANLCRTGSTSGDVRSDQAPFVGRPELVTLIVGINDVVHGLPDEAFAINLEEIAIALARTGAKVVLGNIPDLALAPIAARIPRANYERRIEAFNEHALATASRHGFAFVDLFELSRRCAPGNPELFSPDGFHPSAEGYERWTEWLWPAVRASLPGEPQAALGT